MVERSAGVPAAGKNILELNTKYKYESKDKNKNWWCVTLLSLNEDGTYKVEVHDGTGKIWPVVYRDNIRLARPRTPNLVPDVEWDGKKLMLLASTSHKIVFEAGGKNDLGGVTTVRVSIPYKKLELSVSIAKKVVPEHHRAYLELLNLTNEVLYSFPMPSPQHAVYPLLRRILDLNNVAHNIGVEPAEVIDEWHRHTDDKGLFYWHNTVTKANVWKEPDGEPVDQLFEKQLEHAKKASVAGGVRSKDDTTAEMDKLVAKLTKLSLKERRVADDGHCQFRSIAYFIKKDEDRYREVREEVVTYLRRHHEIYANFVDSDFSAYCKKMASSNAWGDHVTLVAAANLYNVKIEVINSGDAQLRAIMPRDAEGSISHPKQTIQLSYIEEPNAMHYNPVVEVQGG